MHNYSVHLVFHLLAIAIGAAFGVTAGMWRSGLAPIWVPALALLVGAVLIILEGLYIQHSGQARRYSRSRSAPASSGGRRP